MNISPNAEKFFDATGIQDLNEKIREILKDACKRYGFTLEELLSPLRTDSIANARTYAVIRLRDELKLSFQDIGRILKRHHSSIIHHYGMRMRAYLLHPPI